MAMMIGMNTAMMIGMNMAMMFEMNITMMLQALRKQCQNFATALLDHTRSSGELGQLQLNTFFIYLYQGVKTYDGS